MDRLAAVSNRFGDEAIGQNHPVLHIQFRRVVSKPTGPLQIVRHNIHTQPPVRNRKQQFRNVTTASFFAEILDRFLWGLPAIRVYIHSFKLKMHYPGPLRRLGIVPDLVRLVAIILEVLSFVFLCVRHDPDYSWTTSYVIVSEPIY